MGSKNQLWRPVVSTHDVGCVHWVRLRVLTIQYFAGTHIANAHLSILEQDVLRLQVPVADANLMHVLQSVDDLTNKLFDQGHVEAAALVLFLLLEHVLEALVAILEHRVLDDTLLAVKRVEKVQELDNILFATKHVKDFELPGNDIPSLLRSFECNHASTILVNRFEDAT